MTAYGTISGSRVVDPAVALVVKEFVDGRLYGSVEIKFEAGRVVLIRKSESIKPAVPNTGDEDER